MNDSKKFIMYIKLLIMIYWNFHLINLTTSLKFILIFYYYSPKRNKRKKFLNFIYFHFNYLIAYKIRKLN